MKPDSPVNLHHLAYVPNVNASITNTLTDRDSAAAGARTFGRVCSSCHGDDARGRTGPNLLAAITDLSDWQFFATVKWGRPKTMMVAQPLSEREIWQICAFLRQSALDAALGEKSADAAPTRVQPVSAEMLRSAGQSGDWLTYAGNYAGHRHAIHTQINRDNVGRLRLAWAAQLPSDGGYQESSPIVVGDRMFVTEPPEGVTALDARNGTVLWQFHRPIPSGISSCCGAPNKGVAVLGTHVYVTSFDSHLIALDAATGTKLWDVTAADWHQGYTMTGAPLAIGDSIVIGVAGGDFGVRGFLDAYRAADGSKLWRFYTVPGPGQPGHDTWSGDTWQHGGASTWVTGAYDPNLGLIYWGTGNPGPVFDTKTRAGRNLYTCSLVAVDARTGELRWYYQFTPGDDRGWDSTQQPVLADIVWQGQVVPGVLVANRNGFLYALDRRTGHFLYAKAFAEQSWASGFTPDGEPIVVTTAHPSPTGTAISPASNGATSWWPPSLDPKRALLFIPAVDSADTYFNVEPEKYVEGRAFLDGGFVRTHNQATTLALRAFDVSTGGLRWDATLEKGGDDVPGEMGGVLSTGGGLVFAGRHSSEFDAFDSDTGAKLWSIPLGGVIHAAPISYLVGDQQYVAIFAGRTLFVFGLAPDDHATPTDSVSSPVHGKSGAPLRSLRAHSEAQSR